MTIFQVKRKTKSQVKDMTVQNLKICLNLLITEEIKLDSFSLLHWQKLNVLPSNVGTNVGKQMFSNTFVNRM